MTMINGEPTQATIARARTGEESALVELYEWYKPRIQRFLYYRIGDKHAAEDLTTEVFLRMLQNLPSFQFQGIPFQAWLFQIARNLVVDDFRRQSIRNHKPFDESLEASEKPPEEVALGRIVWTELQARAIIVTRKVRVDMARARRRSGRHFYQYLVNSIVSMSMIPKCRPPHSTY